MKFSKQKEVNLKLVSGVHFATYKTDAEFIKLIDYYMSHEDERNQIAKSGGEQVRSLYKIEHFIKQVFE